MNKILLGFSILLCLMLSLSTPLSTAIVDQDHQQYPLNQNDAEIHKALDYLRTLQNTDGGFSNPGEESAISNTQWAIMAIVAAGEDPHEWVKNGHSPIDYLRENTDMVTGSTDYERMVLALIAAGEDPGDFADRNFVVELKEIYLKESGQFSDFTYTTIWGILALSSVGDDVSKSAEWLKAQQNEDGGFAWVPGEKSDYDDTAAAIEALIAAGESPDSQVIRDAIEYLKTGQNEDGGFKYFGSSPSNAASDAWVIQAVVACGDYPKDAEWTINGNSPVDHLLSLQQSDGSFYYTKYTKSNPGYMTVCAIMALLGKSHPIKPLPPLQPEPMVTPTPTVTPAITSTPTPAFTSPQPVHTTKPSAATPETTFASDDTELAGFEFLSSTIGLLVVALAVLVRREDKRP